MSATGARAGFIQSICVCALAGTIAAGVSAADVLSQLGITPQAAREAVDTVVNSGVFNPGLPARAFKMLPPAARGEVATAGVAWLKAYAATPEFKQQYARIRDTHKPAPPEFTGTPEDELKKAADEQKRQMEDSKKAIAALPPEQRKALEEALQGSAAVIAQMDTPEMRKMRLDGIKAIRAERTTQYQRELANWQRDYPENPNPVIAKRLREFLALSEGVDFDAATKVQNGRTVFVNPAYEAKPSQWRMCYRAGREATTAARTAVQAWLKEL
jgi:hypothetical protein